MTVSRPSPPRNIQPEPDRLPDSTLRVRARDLIALPSGDGGTPVTRVHQAAHISLPLPDQPLERPREIHRIPRVGLGERFGGLLPLEAHPREFVDGDVDGVTDLRAGGHDEGGDEVLGRVEVGGCAGVRGRDGGDRRGASDVELFENGGELGHGSIF